MKQINLEMIGISKVYPNGVLAIKDVSFSLCEGEIHALAGENGAGKSTLMKILYGLEIAQEGEIRIGGKRVEIRSPLKALEYEIGMVHQHFMLVDSLSVAENIVLGMEPLRGGRLDRKRAVELTLQLAGKCGVKIDPNAPVGTLPVGVKQKVEIMKVLARGAKILILDEPTAVLTPQETQEFFDQLRMLRSEGHTIVIITHKLKEIKELCDRISIMRNGHMVGVYQVSQVSQEEISRLMVGRDVKLKIDKAPAKISQCILKVKNLSHVNVNGKRMLKDISFCARRGEVIGIAGVEGNGQQELVEVLTRLEKNYTGTITFKDRDISSYSVRDIRDAGLAHIPEDRMSMGTVVNESIKDNLISVKIGQKAFDSCKGLFINSKKVNNYANGLIQEFCVKCDSQNQSIKMLSGGNMQKVVCAREIDTAPDLLIADQPSRGVDVGSIEFIHRKILELRDSGTAVILISADLNEIFNLSDSLLVFCEGEIAAYLDDITGLNEQELGKYMLGLKKQSNESIRKAAYE